MDDAFRQMLLKARDQYEGAVRWTAIVLCVVLFLHFTVVSEWAVLKGKLVGNQQALERYRNAQQQAETLKQDVEELEKSTVKFADQLSADLVTRLRQDFDRLSAALEMAFTGFPDSSQPDVESDGAETEPDASMAVQSRAPRSDEEQFRGMIQRAEETASRMKKEFGLTEERIQALKRVQNDREALVTKLTPLVRSRIVQPEFERLNQRWDDQVKRIEKTSRALHDRIQALERSFPEAGEELSSLGNAVNSVMEQARSLQFEPPQDNRWWRTGAGKQSYAVQMTDEARSELSGVSMARNVGNQIIQQVQAALSEQKRLTATLRTELESVQQQLNEQIDRLRSLATPLEFLALDVELLLKRLPFLIGFLTAMGIAWTTYRAGQLRRLIRTLKQSDSMSEPFRQLAELMDVSSAVELTAALGVCSGLWLGMAVYTAMISRAVSRSELWLSSTVGGVLIVLSIGYRWWTLHRK